MRSARCFLVSDWNRPIVSVLGKKVKHRKKPDQGNIIDHPHYSSASTFCSPAALKIYQLGKVVGEMKIQEETWVNKEQRNAMGKRRKKREFENLKNIN